MTKRTARIAMRLFLKLNGYDLVASPEEKYKRNIPVATSAISENEMVRVNLASLWARNRAKKEDSVDIEVS